MVFAFSARTVFHSTFVIFTFSAMLAFSRFRGFREFRGFRVSARRVFALSFFRGKNRNRTHTGLGFHGFSPDLSVAQLFTPLLSKCAVVVLRMRF